MLTHAATPAVFVRGSSQAVARLATVAAPISTSALNGCDFGTVGEAGEGACDFPLKTALQT
jgi:hypothetical protein